MLFIKRPEIFPGDPSVHLSQKYQTGYTSIESALVEAGLLNLAREKRGEARMCYLGERGQLEIDPKKLTCPRCREQAGLTP